MLSRARDAVVSILLLMTIGSSALPSQERPRGVLAGIVRDTNSQPLPLVLVTVLPDSSRTALTDSGGAYRIDGLSTGIHKVLFRRMGFIPGSFHLVAAESEERRVIVELVPAPLRLDTVTISGTAASYPPLERSGFYDRLRAREDGAGVGRFITPEEMERLRSLTKTTHVLETAGVRLIHQERGMALWPVGTSNIVLRGRPLLIGPCQMAVFIDGIEVDIGKYYQPPAPGEAGSMGGMDAYIRPQEIRAIEVYHSASGTPQQFQSVRNAQCGSIVIWTK